MLAREQIDEALCLARFCDKRADRLAVRCSGTWAFPIGDRVPELSAPRLADDAGTLNDERFVHSSVGLRHPDERVQGSLCPAVVDRRPRSARPCGQVGDGTADHEAGSGIEHDDVAMRSALTARAPAG